MSRPKNQQIGEVECIAKQCTQRCAVFRFRQRTEGKQRFAGKLYFDCPVHGRYGADGRAGLQEYILENAKIWGDTKPASETPAAPVPPAPRIESTSTPKALVLPVPDPATVPEPAKPKPSPWWETILK